MKILDVKILIKEDESPDTSWIGKYSDRLDEWDIVASGPGEGKFVCDVLRNELEAMGFSSNAIDEAFDDVKSDL